MTRLRSESGQAAVISILFVTVLLGMAALVIDVGTWYKAQREAQVAADASALAGAQALPEDPGTAEGLAQAYATKNGGGLDTTSYGSKFVANDTISVRVARPAPGFFSKMFGIGSVEVEAKAAARSANISQARFAAPIGVDRRHPFLAGTGCPCFGEATRIDLNLVAPGGFRLLNIDGSRGGTGSATLGDWMRRGLDANMPLGWYYSDPGAKFDSLHMQGAMDARIGSELLFPIYEEIRGSGANAEYKVIGWVGFHLTGYKARGNSGELFGWFTRTIWAGIQSERGDQPDFGVRAIQLVD